MAISYNNIGNLYLEINAKESIVYFEKSYKLFESIGNKCNIAMMTLNIGTAHLKLKEYQMAIKCFDEAVNLQLNADCNDDIATTYNSMAETYMMMADFKNALSFALKGFQMAEEKNSLPLINASYQLLAQIYEKKGLFEEANHYLNLIYKHYRQPLWNRKNQGNREN